MPSLTSVIGRFAKQTMVYWEKVGSDEYGKPYYKDPVELAVRWEARVLEIIMDDGRRAISRAYILLATRVLVGSLVMLGTLDDWKVMDCYPDPPPVQDNVSELIIVKDTPDIKARTHVYEAYA
jgi:hypothetical protein